jgi:hypothetical protein
MRTSKRKLSWGDEGSSSVVPRGHKRFPQQGPKG